MPKKQVKNGNGNGEMTLGKLAQMVAKGFERVDDKFREADERAYDLEDRMDKGFGLINEELVVINSHLESIDETIFNLGNNQTVSEKENEKEIKKLKRRTGVLEKKGIPRHH